MSESKNHRGWKAATDPRQRPRSVASFVWTDTESEDELIVEVRGCETFFDQLRHLGFERLSQEAREDEPATPRRSQNTCKRVLMDVTPAQKQLRARRGA